MKTKAMVKGLGLALATCAGLGLAGQANADVYALSKIDITDLFIVFSGDITNDLGFPASVGPTAYEFSSDAGSTLNNNAAATGGVVTCTGNFAAGTTDCGDGSAGPVLSGDVANAPGGDTDRVEDTFNVISEAGGEFSNAESAIITSTLTSPTPFDGTDVSAISESNLVTGSVAAADTTTKSRTSLDVEFIVSGDDASNVTILFDAAWDQAARITAPDDTGGTTSSLSFLTALTGTGGAALGYEAVWNPGAFGGFGCTNFNCFEGAVGGDLNQDITTDQQGSPQANSGSGFFAATFAGLETGTYSLSLTTTTSTLLSRPQEVPVPGTLLLMGVGLLAGAGMSRRKKV